MNQESTVNIEWKGGVGGRDCSYRFKQCLLSAWILLTRILVSWRIVHRIGITIKLGIWVCTPLRLVLLFRGTL